MKKIVPTIAIVCIATCWMLWPHEALSHGAITTTVLFDREIVRILNNRCVMCHVEDGLSFPLATYEQTWLRGRSIRTEVLRRHMPPWPAVAGYGQFINDNGLTSRETQFMVSWVEGLGPRNAGTVFLNVLDPQAATRQEVRAFAHVGHWQLGEPDLTRQLEANRIESRQTDTVRRTVIDLGLTSERRVRALEYLPGDRRVVRAAVFTVQATGQWLGSWTPWYGFVKLPDGVAYRLPAGSRIVAEVHYRGASEPVVDRGTLGLFFTDRRATRPPTDLVLDAEDSIATDRRAGLNGPPGPGANNRRAGLNGPPAAAQRLIAVTRLASDTYVWALRPDITPGVKSIEVSAHRPDGGTDILLFAREPSVEWPTPFILREPLLLRRGTELSLVARSDSADAASRPSGVRLTISRY